MEYYKKHFKYEVWEKEAFKKFGSDCSSWLFQCPICGRAQGLDDFSPTQSPVNYKYFTHCVHGCVIEFNDYKRRVLIDGKIIGVLMFMDNKVQKRAYWMRQELRGFNLTIEQKDEYAKKMLVLNKQRQEIRDKELEVNKAIKTRDKSNIALAKEVNKIKVEARKKDYKYQMQKLKLDSNIQLTEEQEKELINRVNNRIGDNKNINPTFKQIIISTELKKLLNEA